MKLHLPCALRKILLFACAATVFPAWGGGMHEDMSKRTYSDYGQNKGRFRVSGISSMLQAIRDRDGGIAIQKPNGDVTWVIPESQGMIDFSNSVDFGPVGTMCHGAGAAFGANYIVTVAHNPGFNASFGVTQLSNEHSIKYSTVNIQEKDLGNKADWALYRQNKIFTDVVGAHNYSGVASEQQDLDSNGIPDIKEQLEGQKMYRAFAGNVVVWTEQNGLVDAGSPYTAILGGIDFIRAIAITDEGLIFADWNLKPEDSWVSEKSPLPTNSQGGDSGSPIYVYNQEAGRYEYLFSLRAGNFTTYNVGHGAVDYANEIQALHNVEVDMSTSGTAYLNAVAGGTGSIELGEETISHLAVNSGSHTWKNLSDVKNNDNWYAYGNGYMNGIDGLGRTNNLVFKGGASSAPYEIILRETVDTGVGYLEFSQGSFTIRNEEGGDYMLNSAGFVINEDAEVRVQLTNDSQYMREWRKNGAGDLYIEGSGDNNILLAVGGKGTTYLDRADGGYAAYNVLASSGAKVVISDKNQIERDFTFGYNGGTLDMNGNSMDWYTTNPDIEAEGFSINALTDDALIINSSGTTVLNYKQSGNTTWKGSLKDSTGGSLSVVADMGAGSVWTMNSICTDLSQNAGSSFSVKSGTVVLSGINTEHGTGSVEYSDEIFFSEDDWHYADAKMNVTVENGAAFQLGTHARLLGDITVKGTYVMNEGVHHQMEYIEGGLLKEDTSQWAGYYGHQGNTVLDGGAMKVEFADKTTTAHTYTGNITGTGTVSVDAANSMLVLTGNNSFSGARSVVRGTLMVEDAAAAGSEKWLVGEQGAFAARNADGNAALQYIDGESTGVLALSQNQTSQIDVSEHDGLIIGALAGQTIQYGTLDTTEQLEASKGVWRLGGGGGNLVVNYHLTGDNMLVLGNEYTKGVVTLTNSRNDFTGGIDFAGSGVTLDYTSEAAIKHATLNLRYGNRIAMSSLLGNILTESDGILLVNNASENLNLSNHAALFLGSKENLTYTGNITVSDNQAYRLSAGNGTLAIDSRLGGAHDLIVDAQGYSGGVVQLNNLSELSGNVTVMGYDRSKSEMQNGDITLKVTQDNVLDSVDTITLKAGGTLHIDNSTQNIGKLEMEEGSSLIGNRNNSGKTSTVYLEIDSIADIKGQINVDTVHRYGESTLELNNSMYPTGQKSNLQYSKLYVEEGDVRLTEQYSSIGNLYIRDNTLYLNGKSLSLGGVIAEDGAVIDATVAGSAIGGTGLVRAASGTVTMKNNGNDVTLAGNVGAMNGATLKLVGQGKWIFSGTSYNSSTGTLRVEDASQLEFSGGTKNTYTHYSAFRVMQGTLDLSQSITALVASSDKVSQHMTLDTIKLNGQNLTLKEKSKSASWIIGNLDSGNAADAVLTWEATCSNETSYQDRETSDVTQTVWVTNASRLILNGDNSFKGSVVAKRTANGSGYSSFVELAHNNALKNATLNMQGMQGAFMSLAVNTENAQVQGLNGDEYSHAYSGASSDIKLAAAPTGDGRNTLTITGSGSYEYKGSVHGLNIAMNGSGTQKFSGNSVEAQNIAALSGSLEFTHAPTVADTISIAQGATLKFADAYSLDEGVTLAMIAGESGASGTLEGGLLLNGGILQFDATALNDQTPLLMAETDFGQAFTRQAISFGHYNELKQGSTYTLLSGNWAGREVILADDMPDYLSASQFAASADGLSVTIQFADSFHEWRDDMNVFAAGNTVLFRDSSYATTLDFEQPVTAGGIRIVNEETYTFTGQDVTLTGDLNVESGKLVLNNKVTAADYTAAEGEVEIAATGTLVLTDTQETTATVSNISGSGMLQLSLGTDYGNKLAVDEAFEGTTRIAQGNLTLTGSTFGSTLKLANGVNAQITAETTIDGNLELEGTTQVYQDSGNKLTVNGDVTGSNGTWERRGGGTLDINGSVSLAGFDTGSDSTTSNFNGTTEITTVTLDQSDITANFNGNATVETLNPSGTGVTLGGTGKLSVGNFNLASGKSVTIDALSIVESSAQTRSWNNNTINLKNGASLDTRQSYYNHSSGTLTIGGSDANGTMYVKGLCLMPSDAGYAKSELNVSSGAHLIIAGETSGTTDSDFVLAVGGEQSQLSVGANKINVYGTLTSNAAMTLYRKAADVTIQNGGRLNLLEGLVLKGTAYNDWLGAMNANLQVQEGGQLYAAGGTNRSELLVNIASGATLGAIGEADSTVTFRNNMTLGTAGKDGTITVDTAATTADDNFLLTRRETMGVTVDMTGSLNLQGNTTVEVIGSGALRHKAALNKAAAIHVQEGASLAVDSSAGLETAVALNKGCLVLDTATASGSLSIADAATIHATGGSSTMSAAVTLTNDATVTYNVDADAILDATGGLSVVSSRGHLVKQGEGFLKVKNEADALTSIAVEAGSMNVYGTDTYDLNDLKILSESTLMLYEDDGSTEATVNVSGSATFAAGASLYANLVLSTGVNLDIAAGGLSMGSSVSLQEGVLLSDTVLARIHALSTGEHLTLFTGVDGLELSGVDYAALLETDAVLASSFFSNIGSDDYLIIYTGAAEGTLGIVRIVPEPATTTLGLLALCGLVARRRRK